MKHLLRFAALIVLLGVLFLGRQVLAQQPEPIGKHSGKVVMIGPDDTLDIVAVDFDKLTKQWRVGSSGDLNFPYIGRVHAAGKTVQELEEELTVRSGKYIKDPHVTVLLVEMRSQPVKVTGTVEKPGVYQLDGQNTLFEVLLKAGGTKGAGPTVTVFRNAERGAFDIPGIAEHRNDGNNFVELDLVSVMSGHGDQATLEILPRDTIVVSPPRPPRYVQIVGEVTRPGAIELVTKDSVSLAQAIAVAGGTTPLASKGSMLIWHINETGVRSERGIVIDLNLIEKGEAKDLLLTAGDIVQVQRSTAKAVLQMATTAAFSTGISSAILVISRI